MTESHTVVLAAVPEPPPVFVDATGRRRRFVRYLAYGVGLLGLGYIALVGVSLAGGPVNPNSVLPFADLVGGPQAPLPNPVPVEVAPTVQPTDSGSPGVPERAGRPSTTPSGTPGPAPTVTATGAPMVTQPGNTVPGVPPPVVPVEPSPAVPDDPPTEPSPTRPTVTEPPLNPVAGSDG